MKFTSIVFAAVVAATQFSSTLAAPVGQPDFVSTTDGVTLTGFNVLANDSGTGILKVTDYASCNGCVGTSRSPGTDLTLPSSATVDVPGTVSITVDGILTFTPVAGFVGVTTFIYVYQENGGGGGGGADSVAVDVTITVGAAPPNAAFVNPFGGKQISTANAVNTVRGGLFNVAPFAAAGLNNAGLTALLAPVSDNANFLNNTSFDVVTDTFNNLFAGFFNNRFGGNF